MKHAGPVTLERLKNFLDGLRKIPGLVERRPGTFYRKSKAFLHFHEDPTGVFADVRLDGNEFERIAVNNSQEQMALLDRIRLSI
ncbi:MAG: hypothetical protein KA740_02825 [Rhodoferax sp.]|nr:hypothetical protein [Rhodoferax sp.]